MLMAFTKWHHSLLKTDHSLPLQWRRLPSCTWCEVPEAHLWPLVCTGPPQGSTERVLLTAVEVWAWFSVMPRARGRPPGWWPRLPYLPHAERTVSRWEDMLSSQRDSLGACYDSCNFSFPLANVLFPLQASTLSECLLPLLGPQGASAPCLWSKFYLRG
jgi:hypothetical protein